MQLAEVEDLIDATKQMTGRNVIVETEPVKQIVLWPPGRRPIIPACSLSHLGFNIAKTDQFQGSFSTE